MSRDIIEAIDGALEDWQVSGDAMRWTPDPPEVDGRRVFNVPATALWVEIADVHAPTADELARGVDLGMRLEYGGHDFTPPPFYVTFTTVTEQFQRAVEQVAETISRIDPDLIEAFLAIVRPDPQSGPARLCIDGHAYRRRARRRRR